MLISLDQTLFSFSVTLIRLGLISTLSSVLELLWIISDLFCKLSLVFWFFLLIFVSCGLVCVVLIITWNIHSVLCSLLLMSLTVFFCFSSHCDSVHLLFSSSDDLFCACCSVHQWFPFFLGHSHCCIIFAQCLCSVFDSSGSGWIEKLLLKILSVV